VFEVERWGRGGRKNREGERRTIFWELMVVLARLSYQIREDQRGRELFGKTGAVGDSWKTEGGYRIF